MHTSHQEGGRGIRSRRIRVLDDPQRAAFRRSVASFLHELGGPTLIRVAGRDRSRTRALVTLLHGNEPSGIRALHAWLRSGATPAVDALLLIGAVDAALRPPGFAHRTNPGRPDLNRCFRAPFLHAEGELAAEALAWLRGTRPEALIDLHNTTGHTPAYGVGPGLDPAQLDLVALFAPRYVHNDLRLGALVEATAAESPSVVVECGRAGDAAADRVALHGLETYLGCAELPRADRSAMLVLGRPLRVTLRPGIRVGFGSAPLPGVDLTVEEDLDRFNFDTLPPGSRLGWLRRGAPWPLAATGADGVEQSRQLFDAREGQLETRRALVPIMMTTRPEIARLDCLCYVASRMLG